MDMLNYGLKEEDSRVDRVWKDDLTLLDKS